MLLRYTIASIMATDITMHRCCLPQLLCDPPLRVLASLGSVIASSIRPEASRENLLRDLPRWPTTRVG